MNKRRLFLSILYILLFVTVLSGCQVISVFQYTPVPLETPTPKLSLNQVTDIPTLPVITPTSTPQAGETVRYTDPSDIFLAVTEEKLPEKAYDTVVIFGTFAGFVTSTDNWGNTVQTGSFRITHHSGTEFSISCDDFCFYTDAMKNLIPSTSLKNGSEVIIIGAADEAVTDINADLVAVHTLAEKVPSAGAPVMSGLPSGMTYTEFRLESFPALNPIRISGAALSAETAVLPTETPAQNDPYSGYGYNDYSYNNYGYGYGYGYGSYGQPTSTPNQPPTSTPTPVTTDAPQPAEAEDLNDRLAARLNHTLSNRTAYSYGAYGEQYSVYIAYDDDQNRDPRRPSRAQINVESNGYDFTEYWIPYVQNPMFYNWGIVCYAGDWYLPLRMTVDIDPDPGTVDLLYADRTICSQKNFDEQQGYLRSFGFSIIDSKLFYFYQKESGYGISINRQDYDLGFDDIPFGYVGNLSEIAPFYSDDLITFFGHRNGAWYYVELEAPEEQYYYY